MKEISKKEELDALFNETQTLAVVLYYASFSKSSKALKPQLIKIAPEFETVMFAVCNGASEDGQDLAIAMGVKSFPRIDILRAGRIVSSASNIDDMKQTLASEIAQNAPVPETGDDDALRGIVRDAYASTATGGTLLETDGGAIGGCCDTTATGPRDYEEISLRMGYTKEALERLKAQGTEANLGLGCGNPMTFAQIKEGETVVDLGSGAGIDCFLAAELVGPMGKVIGVDMTPEMISKARQNARLRLKAKVDDPGAPSNSPKPQTNQVVDNVSFRLGEIEYLPVGDNTADCVISNCVINLSPTKPQVYAECLRVLRPGGRLCVSDVVALSELPSHLKTNQALAC